MTSENDSAAILLAAGAGVRFGGDKLGAAIKDEPVIAHSAKALTAFPLRAVILSARTKHHAPLLQELGFEVIINPQAEKGMSTSLREGVSWAQEKNAGRVLIALADMPFVTPNHLNALIERCMARKENASFTKCGQRRSPPAAFGKDWFTPLRQLTGDAGAREILAELPATCGVEAAADMLHDIDRPQDLPGAPSCA